MKSKSKSKSKHLSLKFKRVASSLMVLLTTLIIFCTIMVLIVKNKMELQMKTDGKVIVNQIQERMTSNQTVSKELDILLSDKIVSSSYLIGVTPNITNEYLIQISKKLNIDEINVADSNGIIIFSNMAGNLKYKYPEDHAVQKIVKDKKIEVIEKIRESTILKDSFYKYGAVATPTGGFVQIGILANKVNAILTSVSPQALIDELGKESHIAYALTIGKDLNYSIKKPTFKTVMC